MKDEWVDRLIAERYELKARLHNLRLFRTTPTYFGLEEVDRGLLNEQEKLMSRYLDVLNRRVARVRA